MLFHTSVLLSLPPLPSLGSLESGPASFTFALSMRHTSYSLVKVHCLFVRDPIADILSNTLATEE